MKLLIVIPYFTFGGIEKQVFLISKGLQKKGIDVSVFATNRTNQEPLKDVLLKNNINIGYLESIYFVKLKKPIKRVLGWIKFILLIRSYNFDVVMPFTNHPCLVFASSWRFMGLSQCLYQYRGGSPKKDSYKYFWKFEKKFRPQYIVNSKHAIAKLAIVKETNNNNIHFIRNISQPISAVVVNKEKYGFLKKEGELLLVKIANFFPQKDHLTIVKAFKFLLDEGINDIKLVLVGNFHHSKSLHKEIVDYINRHNLTDKIILLGSINDTFNLLTISDIGILSTESEGCPNVLLEYMDAGLPFVASMIDANKEFSPVEQHEFLFEYRNVESAKNKLKDLIVSSKKREALKSINKTFVSSFEKSESVIREYLALIRK